MIDKEFKGKVKSVAALLEYKKAALGEICLKISSIDKLIHEESRIKDKYSDIWIMLCLCKIVTL